MGEFEKDLIERGRRAIKGDYSIALGNLETEIFIEGLQEIKRRYHIISLISDTWMNADIMELLAKLKLKAGLPMLLKDDGIKLMIRAIRLRGKRRKALHKKLKCLDRKLKMYRRLRRVIRKLEKG